MRKYIYVFLMFIVVLLPISVKAASVSVSLNCPSKVVANTEFECSVYVVGNGTTVNGLSGNYNLSGVTFISFVPNNGFNSLSTSTSGFAFGNNAGVSGQFVIGTLKLKTSNGGTVSLINLSASDTLFNDYSPSTASTNIGIKSSNANLTGLSLTTGILSPAFNANTTSYTATVDAPGLSIYANAVAGATVSGTGYKNLNYGVNTFNIVVTSEAGNTKTYIVTITRPDNRSTNNYLSALSISSGNISFNKNTNKYNIDVEGSVASVNIGANLEDSKATFVAGFGARTVNLNYGLNSVLVKVKAENGSVRTYTLNITRKDNRSNNNNLKSLKITGSDLPFDKEVLNYNVSVPYETTEVEILTELEDVNSQVVVNNYPLAIGENTLTVVVTAENGENKTYTIIVKRLSEAEKMSDNNNISEMKIFGHDFKFDKDTYKYDVTIGVKEEELLFYITMEDVAANYSIKGNKEIKDGSEVIVTAISESGLKKEYFFKVTKEKVVSVNKKSDIKDMIIPCGISVVVGLILGFFIGTIIYSKKLKNNTLIGSVASVPDEVETFQPQVIVPTIQQQSINQVNNYPQDSQGPQNLQ